MPGYHSEYADEGGYGTMVELREIDGMGDRSLPGRLNGGWMQWPEAEKCLQKTVYSCCRRRHNF